MIGMSTPVTKDVPPFCLAYGNPLKVARLNDYQLGMQSIEESALRLMEGELSYDTTHPLLAELFETFFVRTSRPSAVAISKGVHGMPNKPR